MKNKPKTASKWPLVKIVGKSFALKLKTETKSKLKLPNQVVSLINRKYYDIAFDSTFDPVRCVQHAACTVHQNSVSFI